MPGAVGEMLLMAVLCECCVKNCNPVRMSVCHCYFLVIMIFFVGGEVYIPKLGFAHGVL